MVTSNIWLQVLYKLDKYGNGEEICLEDLPLNHGISFLGFSHNMFLEVGRRLSSTSVDLPGLTIISYDSCSMVSEAARHMPHLRCCGAATDTAG
jgi:hypothetical protein